MYCSYVVSFSYGVDYRSNRLRLLAFSEKSWSKGHLSCPTFNFHSCWSNQVPRARALQVSLVGIRKCVILKFGFEI
jgi:hypothetical protein